MHSDFWKLMQSAEGITVSLRSYIVFDCVKSSHSRVRGIARIFRVAPDTGDRFERLSAIAAYSRASPSVNNSLPVIATAAPRAPLPLADSLFGAILDSSPEPPRT
jgi:hypothetical protein